MPRESTGKILLAEDDEDDYILIREVLDEIPAVRDLRWVRDGEELMEDLHRHLEEPGTPDLPDLILLDLNMPRKDGRTALGEIKTDPLLRRVPVVVLTTSDADRDIQVAYDLGANSYLMKPTGFTAFRDAMERVTAYWFQTVTLPGYDGSRPVDDVRTSA